MYTREGLTNSNQIAYCYPVQQYNQYPDYNQLRNSQHYLSNPTVIHHATAAPQSVRLSAVPPQHDHEEIIVHQHREVQEIQDIQPVHSDVHHIQHHTINEVYQTKNPVKLKKFTIPWVPRKKLELSEFESFYSMSLVDYVSSAEYLDVIEQCTLRFRRVVKPWRTFWSKQKKLMPAEFVAAMVTLCLSMIVTTPLWYKMYGKAKVG